MKVRSLTAAVALVAAVLGSASVARADTTFTLVTAGTLPASGNPYGAVTVSSVDANTLKFDVELSGTNHFANTGIDASFAFNLAGFNTITVAGLPSSGSITWSALNTNTTTHLTTAGSIHMDGAGFFDYGVTFSNGGNTDGQSLIFTIAATNLGLNTNNVTKVAADICTLGPNQNNNCSTGGLTGAVTVPAPILGAGLPSLLLACGGLVAAARRRRNRKLA